MPNPFLVAFILIDVQKLGDNNHFDSWGTDNTCMIAESELVVPS